MSRAAIVALIGLALAFVAGWKVCDWQRDSVDLAVRKAATATGKELQTIAGTSARRLEDVMTALKAGQPKEIRYEIVKPVFTNVCVSDEFVRLYNDAAGNAERALSGKPQNNVSGKTAAP